MQPAGALLRRIYSGSNFVRTLQRKQYCTIMLQTHTFEATLGGADQWGSSKRTLELAKLGLEDCRSGQVRPGDPIFVEVPAGPFAPLQPV